MAKNRITEATRLLLQTSSKVYYDGLPHDAKASVHGSFRAMDKSGAGRISFRDFIDSGSMTTLHHPARVGLFRFLDADGTGFLELNEFLLLHYINESGACHCSACGIPIISGGYSCTDCPPPGPYSFDICVSCYTSPTTPAGFMHHHPRTSFVNLVANFARIGASLTPNCSSTMPSNYMTRETVHINEPSLSFSCDCCGSAIVTDRFTCNECVNSFDLCQSCYGSPPPYFQHQHPYSSFRCVQRNVQSQATAEAAMAAAMMSANYTAFNNDMTAAINANVAAMSAAAINANRVAAMGHLNHNVVYPNYVPPAQGNNNLVSTGIKLIGKALDFSVQSGLFN